jgi:hypothetical protein
MAKARHRKNGSDRTKILAVITLRMPFDLKKKLQDHCHALSGKAGRHVSYNEALLEIVREAVT